MGSDVDDILVVHFSFFEQPLLILSSNVAPAICLPQIRGGPPTVSLIFYVVHRKVSPTIDNLYVILFKIIYPGHVVTRFKICYFENVIQDAMLIQSPVGEELLASVWDRRQSSTVSNLGSY